MFPKVNISQCLCYSAVHMNKTTHTYRGMIITCHIFSDNISLFVTDCTNVEHLVKKLADHTTRSAVN